MATTQEQVIQAIAEIKATKRLASGKVSKNAVYGVMKRFKAMHGTVSYENTEFSEAIHKAAWGFIQGE